MLERQRRALWSCHGLALGTHGKQSQTSQFSLETSQLLLLMTIVFCDHKETENHVKELHVVNLKLVHEKLPSTPLDPIPTKTRIPVLKIEAKRHP